MIKGHDFFYQDNIKMTLWKLTISFYNDRVAVRYVVLLIIFPCPLGMSTKQCYFLLHIPNFSGGHHLQSAFSVHPHCGYLAFLSGFCAFLQCVMINQSSRLFFFTLRVYGIKVQFYFLALNGLCA